MAAAAPSLIEQLCLIRAHEPERVAQALAERPAGPPITALDRLMVVACDHSARGALAAGGDPVAMGSREELLRRCVTALARPGVNGFLGTADLVEDLTLLGALDGKVVFGSMNRGGLAGASFELDDRMTAYDVDGLAAARLDGGKMLLRLGYDDPRTADTMEACAHAVDALAQQGLTAMIEPFVSRRWDGKVVNDLNPDAVITAICVAAGLGRTSAHTWLKIPAVADMERVVGASTLPTLILGGAVRANAEAARRSWAQALALPNVRGLVIGRSLLFPPDDDVAGAVDKTVGLFS
ncbi:Uncharacterised protein [Actinomyces bovis]|uniref:Cgl0159-like domain-containing protein n=1 Tax=Actinomyces bovis TaxID=1658 RepID=A0ABY1VM60_9ACTO|nr:deoxyribose-phosphate aldolase [Actinomyces bovis]SPT52837.1 Uncharacterised protein [Actinomyces bovis]VEG54912.1 Uncharacterised protein [Actinomyces israelii]